MEKRFLGKLNKGFFAKATEDEFSYWLGGLLLEDEIFFDVETEKGEKRICKKSFFRKILVENLETDLVFFYNDEKGYYFVEYNSKTFKLIVS